MSAPCFLCGAAHSCHHREAEPTRDPPKVDMRSVPQPEGYTNRRPGLAAGQGYNFNGVRAQELKAALRKRKQAAKD